MVIIYFLLYFYFHGVSSWCLNQLDQCFNIEQIKQINQQLSQNQISLTNIFDLEQDQIVLFKDLPNNLQVIIDNSTEISFIQTIGGMKYIPNNFSVNVTIIYSTNGDSGMKYLSTIEQLIMKLNKSIIIKSQKSEIIDFQVRSKFRDWTTVTLDIQIEYSMFIETRMRLKMKYQGIIIYFEDFEPQKKFIYETKITLENPKLWWPVRYGDQNLYNFEIQHQQGNGWQLVYTQKYGIRQILCHYDRYQNYAIKINQIEIISKEVRIDVSKTNYHLTPNMMIQNAINLGFNLIRIQEQFVNEEFFQLADQYGLMVKLILWDEQDITINNDGQQLINSIIRYKNYCSIVAYGGILDWVEFGNSQQSYHHNDIALNIIPKYVDKYNSQQAYIIMYNPALNEEQDSVDYTTYKIQNQEFNLNQDHFDSLKQSYELTFNKFDQIYYINCIQFDYYYNMIWKHKQNLLINNLEQKSLPSLNKIIDQQNCKLAGAYAIKQNQQLISVGYKVLKGELIVQLISEFFIIQNVSVTTQLRYFVNNTILHKQNDIIYINRYIPTYIKIMNIRKQQQQESYVIVKIHYNNNYLVRQFTLDKPNQLKLQKPKLQIDYQGNLIRIVSDTYTKFVYLYHRCICLNPSDNYFDLLPNQENFVELEKMVPLSEIEIKYLII